METNKKIEFVEAAKKFAPNFNIARKQESRLMRFLNFFVRLWCPQFMTNFVTTIGSTVYLDEDSWKDESSGTIGVLAHELRHVCDRSWYYEFLYLLPQCLAGLSLLSLLSIWFGLWHLFWLCALLCLLPLPAPGRSHYEKRGYSMSIAVRLWVVETLNMGWAIEGDTSALVSNFSSYFTDASYYFMWPFRNNVQKYFVKEIDRIKSGNLDDLEKFVKQFVQN